MLKLTIGVLAVVLAGSAGAAGWRSTRIDASSEAAFNESVVAFRDKLPYVRKQVFERSLQDIWVEGMEAAQAEGRDYTVTDYLRELDGLKYKLTKATSRAVKSGSSLRSPSNPAK